MYVGLNGQPSILLRNQREILRELDLSFAVILLYLECTYSTVALEPTNMQEMLLWLSENSYWYFLPLWFLPLVST